MQWFCAVLNHLCFKRTYKQTCKGFMYVYVIVGLVSIRNNCTCFLIIKIGYYFSSWGFFLSFTAFLNSGGTIVRLCSVTEQLGLVLQTGVLGVCFPIVNSCFVCFVIRQRGRDRERKGGGERGRERERRGGRRGMRQRDRWE